MGQDLLPDFSHSAGRRLSRLSPIRGRRLVTCGYCGGRYWDRTSDPFGVNGWRRRRIKSDTRSGGRYRFAAVWFGRSGCCTSLLYAARGAVRCRERVRARHRYARVFRRTHPKYPAKTTYVAANDTAAVSSYCGRSRSTTATDSSAA
jgi:hypothetical protein